MTGTILNCGYVPLVDSAPLIIASELGFAADHGLSLNLIRQPSWSALRDMLALGHLDVAHMLAPMPVAMSLGMGGFPAQVDALMVLSVLDYWTAGADGLQIEAVTVPPSRMADAVADGFVDAFWVGEPWGSVAVQQGDAQLMMTGRDVWQFAPEKVLAARRDWIEQNAGITARLMRPKIAFARIFTARPLQVRVPPCPAHPKNKKAQCKRQPLPHHRKGM